MNIHDPQVTVMLDHDQRIKLMEKFIIGNHLAESFSTYLKSAFGRKMETGVEEFCIQYCSIQEQAVSQSSTDTPHNCQFISETTVVYEPDCRVLFVDTDDTVVLKYIQRVIKIMQTPNGLVVKDECTLQLKQGPFQVRVIAVDPQQIVNLVIQSKVIDDL